MSDPKTFYDLEFSFANGEIQCVTVEEGIDGMAADDARVKVTTHPDEHTTMELIVHRDKLNSMRTTKRVVKPEPEFTPGLVGAIQ